MRRAVWRLLECVNNVKVGGDHVVVFCCAENFSCEGVDSNRWFPLQYKLCMNINDDMSILAKVGFFYVHVKTTFMLTSTV
jgi:hypothetical protein